MKKIFLFAIILILTANLLAVESVAIISASKGKVDLRRAAKVIKHKTGDFLQNNDEICTGGESFAAYKYIDGSATVKVFIYIRYIVVSIFLLYLATVKTATLFTKKSTRPECYFTYFQRYLL